jgi:choline transport protein
MISPLASSNMPRSKNSKFAVAEVSSYRQYDKQDGISSAARTIPEKFKGTKNDQDDMVLLGKKQVLRRNFKFTTILGFASTGGFYDGDYTTNTLGTDIHS